VVYFFHESAEQEFNDAIDHYEAYRSGLGLEFAQEVHETIQRIIKFPDAWYLLDGNIRRCLTNRFPFGVVYYSKNSEIIILAVMQLSRKPSYWRDRK